MVRVRSWHELSTRPELGLDLKLESMLDTVQRCARTRAVRWRIVALAVSSVALMVPILSDGARSTLLRQSGQSSEVSIRRAPSLAAHRFPSHVGRSHG
jgi:hypothetical protein